MVSLDVDKEQAMEDSHIYDTVDTVDTESTTEGPLCVKSTPPTVSYPVPGPVSHIPPIWLRSCIQVNNCIVRLVQGNLSAHAADVLVHSGGRLHAPLHTHSSIVHRQ